MTMMWVEADNEEGLLCNSSLFIGVLTFFLHQQYELLKKVVAVVRTWGCLGMILNAEEWKVFVLKTFYRVVVEVDVGQLDFRLIHRLPVDREAVILRGDLNFARLKILYGMVGSTMSELELVRLSPQSESEQLVTEAYAEHRLGADQLLQIQDRVLHCIGIAGAVREKDPVRIHREHLFGGIGRGNNRQVAAVPS